LAETQTAEVADHALRVLRGQYETGVAPRTNSGGPDVANHPPYIESQMAHDADDVLAEVVRNPRLAEWAAEVTGAKRLKVWSFMVMLKYPTGSAKTALGWHQDRHYLNRILVGGSINLWVALDDVPAELGAMRFVAGSNRWNASFTTGIFDHDTDRQKEEITIPEGQEWVEVDDVLPAGWGSIHDAATLHGSGINRGSRPRLSMLINYGIDDFQLLPDSYFATRQNDPRATPVVYPISTR